MKKYITVFLLVLFAGKTFSQVDTAASNSSIKTDYLKKSKTQKTIAWVLVAAGTTLIVIGGSVAGAHAVDNVSFNQASSAAALIIAGAVMDLGSIPLFIAGTKNKRRAMSVTLNNQFAPRLRQNIIARVPMPTIGLRISL